MALLSGWNGLTAVLAAGGMLATLALPPAAFAAGEVVTFPADADARVEQSSPSTNFGSGYLRVNGGTQPPVQSYLRFTVGSLSEPVARARLRVWATGGTVNGPTLHAVTGSWQEASVTWDMRPAHDAPALADLGIVEGGAWAEFDVSSHVTANGTYDFALVPASNDGANFYSREATATTRRPELIVEVAVTGPPVATAPPTISGTAREGGTLSASPGSWTGADPITIAYQWRRCDTTGAGCTAVRDATGSTYALTATDVGKTMRVAVTATNGEGSSTATSAASAVVQAAEAAADPVVAAAGDIAGCGWDRDERTASVLDALKPTAVLPLGDTVYEDGSAAEFRDCYQPTWGRHKGISSPVVGNHEYQTTRASGYFDYFGAAAGDPAKGYYAFDLGAWRLYALNTNCSKVPCAADSTQEQWLRADLAAHPRSCTLAYSHHPRFSSAGSYTSVWALYKAFYEASGDVWLGAHQHLYERLARLSPSGALDAAGVRNFVVGTGGASLFSFGSTITGSQARNNSTHGVLRLTLRPTSYDWEFRPTVGATYTDTGSDTCVGATADTTPPSAPTNLAATAPSGSQVDLSWTASTDNVAVTGYDVLRNGTTIATATATTYTDITVTAGTKYTYTVKARDVAGNLSAASNSATVTPAASSASRTFTAEADARVHEAKPSTNYGGSSYLRVNGGSESDVESYLRFAVSGLGGPVTFARLRLWVTSGTADGPAVWSTTASWTESGLTWNNRPSRSGVGLDDKGALKSGTWAEFDVTPFVTGNGTYTFILAGTSTDGIDMSSGEATDTARWPQLVVTSA